MAWACGAGYGAAWPGGKVSTDHDVHEGGLADRSSGGPDRPVELHGLPFDDLARLLERIGVGAHHAGRVFQGIHRHGLPLHRIPDLGRHAAVIARHTRPVRTEVAQDVASEDGTHKLVLRLQDGARVECVLVPMPKDRITLCVSTQVGCAMACRFCATGTLGLSRHLTAGEVVAQVQAARAWAEARGQRVSRLVFMGMGEPLHAYATTRDALRILTDPHGLCMGSRSIRVSTVGLVPRMRTFAEDFGGRIVLALSLHAGTDATRSRIVPVARAGSLAQLREVCLTWPTPGSRKLMVEYVVLPGVNDTPEELDGVAAFMDGLVGVVNLIPFNPFAGAPYRSPTDDEVVGMADRLRDRGVPTTVRWPRGRGAHGACGQLALASSGGAGVDAST